MSSPHHPANLWFFACSGAGAGSAIFGSMLIGFAGALFGWLMIIRMLRTEKEQGRRCGYTTCAFLLLGVHPAWTVSALSGECGALKILATGLASAAFVFLAATQKTQR